MGSKETGLEKRPQNSLFVVFEGPHGSGKSYYSKSLIKKLKQKGYVAVYTKEPYSKPLKKFIRTISTKEHNNPHALFYLVTADRYLHLKDIEKQLAQGVIVVSDRYFYSTGVYQRIQGIPHSLIELINRTMPLPDILFYIDTPLRVRKDRFSRRRRTYRDIFYDDKLLRLENKFYDMLKEKLINESYAVIIDGESRDEVGRIVDLVLKKASRSSQQ